jgi:hypothetical protein
MCQKSVESRDIRHREIGVPETVRIGTSQVSKSRRNRDRPSEEDAWQQSARRGKSRQEVDDRRLGHRDIGNPGDNLFMYFGIAKLETPMSGSQLSA